MGGYRLLVPYLLLLVGGVPLVLNSVVERTRLEAQFGERQQRILGGVLSVALALGVFSQGDPFDDGGPVLFPEFEQQWRGYGLYWDHLLEDDEPYILSRAGSLAYAGQGLESYDWQGLVDPCVGRSAGVGYPTGTREFRCTFDRNPVVLDANNPEFAASVVDQMRRHKFRAELAVCGADGPLTDGSVFFFVRSDMVATLQERDPALRTEPIDAWFHEDTSSLKTPVRCGATHRGE